MSDPVPSTIIFYSDVNVQEVHGIILSIAWFILPNFAIWALHFKSNPYAIYVHIACMSLSAFLMAVGPIIMLTYYGASIILQFWYHQLIGFILYCILPILLVSGSVCKISKDRPDVEPSMVYFRNKAHSIFGWVYILLIHVPLLTGWYGGITNYIFGFVILVDGISYAIFFALKFGKKRI